MREGKVESLRVLLLEKERMEEIILTKKNVEKEQDLDLKSSHR